MDKDTFCYVPYRELHVKPNGKYRNCCIQNSDIGRISFKTKNPNQWFDEDWEMQSVRRALKNGIQHPSCSKCWKLESNGLQSYRQNWNKVYADNNNDDIDTRLEVLDLRLGNQCNLKCRMCNSTWSNQISNQIAELQEQGVYNSYTMMDVVGTVRQNDEYMDDLFYFIKNTPTLKEIKLSGGEPFAMEEIEELLFKLVEHKITDLELSIITNTTIVKNEIISTLEKFKSTHIQCSIDGIGQMFEYQRYPCKWEVADYNFAKLYNSKLTVNLTPAWSNLNVLSMAEFLEWTNKFPKSHVAFNEVNTPSYLDWKTIPLDYRQESLTKLKQVSMHSKVHGNYKKFIDKFGTEVRSFTDKELIEYRDAVVSWDMTSKVKYQDVCKWNQAIIK
jgi:organic radical activating enzyme